MARIKNSSYSLPVYVDFETEITIRENNSLTTLEKKSIKNITFGKIPIIVNSRYCVLNLKELFNVFLKFLFAFSEVCTVCISSLSRIARYSVLMVFPLPKTLVKTLAKNL